LRFGIGARQSPLAGSLESIVIVTELLIADPDRATPIRLFGSGDWDTQAPSLPDNVRATLERAGFSGAAGDLALIPGPDGGLSGVYFGMGDAPAPR
jgi:leucyl aminopeptidase